MTDDTRIVKPAEILAKAQAQSTTNQLAKKLLLQSDPPGTPAAKTRLGYVVAFDAATWTCTALIGDQLTQVPEIPVLAGVVPVIECAGMFQQVGDQYTLFGMLNKGPGQVRIRKAADQTINNQATMTNDTELKFWGVAGRSYLMEALILALQNSVTVVVDFKLGWNLPSGATWSSGGLGPVQAIGIGNSEEVGASANFRGYSNIASGTSIPFGMEPDTSNRASTFQLHGSIKMGATSGWCNVAWAQRVNSAINTTVKEGSYLKVDITSEYTL